MFGIGTTELLVFAVIVLFVVGPDRMPTFMRAIGKALRELRSASREFRDAVGLDELMREDPRRWPEVRPPKQTPLSFKKPEQQDAPKEAGVEDEAEVATPPDPPAKPKAEQP